MLRQCWPTHLALIRRRGHQETLLRPYRLEGVKFRLTLLEGSGRVDEVMQNTDQELILSLIGRSTAKPVLRELAAIAKSYHEAATTTPVLPRPRWLARASLIYPLVRPDVLRGGKLVEIMPK